MPEFLTLAEFADIVGAPIGTVRHWRQTGYGPKSAKLGKRVLYRRSDVVGWLDQVFM